jgi:hypothetical protein
MPPAFVARSVDQRQCQSNNAIAARCAAGKENASRRGRGSASDLLHGQGGNYMPRAPNRRHRTSHARYADAEGDSFAQLCCGALRSVKQQLQEKDHTMLRQSFALFAATVFLTGAAGCAAPSVIDDATITARVQAALRKAAGLHPTAISVKTHRGEVVLSGFVENKRMIDRAGRIAWNVNGVLMVFNELDVARRTANDR